MKVPRPVHFGGRGTPLLLAHGNGFPVHSYRLLAERLCNDHEVFGFDGRPMWPGTDPADFCSWQRSANDIIETIEQMDCGPVTGVGHSFGAVCHTLAAAQRPDLYKALVLIEPVIFPKWFYMLYRLVPLKWAHHFSPVAKQALQRTEQWKSQEAAFKRFRKKKVFARMNDESLWAYVKASTMVQPDGTARLLYSKEWEARIFITIHDPWKELRSLQKPLLLLRGAETDTLLPSVWRTMQRKLTRDHVRFRELPDAGHMLPFETPEKVASEIREFLGPHH